MIPPPSQYPLVRGNVVPSLDLIFSLPHFGDVPSPHRVFKNWNLFCMKLQ